MISKSATITYVNRRIDKFQRASKESTVPAIKLSGKWLAEYGFNIGDKINLGVYNNSIIITKGEQQ